MVSFRLALSSDGNVMKVILKVSVCFFTITALVSTFFVTNIAARAVETDRPELVVLDLENAIGLALRANRTLRGSANNLETQRLSLFSTASEFDVRMRQLPVSVPHKIPRVWKQAFLWAKSLNQAPAPPYLPLLEGLMMLTAEKLTCPWTCPF
jgi:hypothetical protein